MRFRFDSVDSVGNAYLGWLVDNVEIVACPVPVQLTFAVEAPDWCGPVVNEAVVTDPETGAVAVQATSYVVEDLYQLWDFETRRRRVCPQPAGRVGVGRAGLSAGPDGPQRPLRVGHRPARRGRRHPGPPPPLPVGEPAHPSQRRLSVVVGLERRRSQRLHQRLRGRHASL